MPVGYEQPLFVYSGGFMTDIKIYSSLEKIFDDCVPAGEITGLSMLRNEILSFQIVFDTDDGCSYSVESDIPDNISLFRVENVPVNLPYYEDHDDFVIERGKGLYPDLLVPVTDYNLKPGRTVIWADIEPGNTFAGKHDIVFRSGDSEKRFSLEIIDRESENIEFIYTNWYHADCLCDYYGVEAMSDEFFEVNRKFISMAVKNGMNCILTPLFTPPLDTDIGGERTTVQLVSVIIKDDCYEFDLSNLKRWIDMCRECGIKYFEMSHLFTQWGARATPKVMALDSDGKEKRIFGWDVSSADEKYISFLTQLSAVLDKFFIREGIKDKVFFHISDEPSKDDIDNYKACAGVMKSIFPDYKFMDALSDYDFYQLGYVDIPVPCEHKFAPFVSNVPDLWVYHCCGQYRNHLPNRFIAMPSIRNRILGLLFYAYDIKGFLQWGYNFYNSHLSKSHINPFECTDAGEVFPSGDSFVVYPGPGGEPYPSLRLKVFRDALQDLKAFRSCKSDEAIEYLKSVTDGIGFENYFTSPGKLLEIREKINHLL